MGLRWKRFFSLVVMFALASALANHFWPEMSGSTKDTVRNFFFNDRRLKFVAGFLFLSYLLVGLEGFTRDWLEDKAKDRFDLHLKNGLNGFFLSSSVFLGVGLGICLDTLVNGEFNLFYSSIILTAFIGLIIFLPLYIFDHTLRSRSTRKPNLHYWHIFIGLSGLVYLCFE